MERFIDIPNLPKNQISLCVVDGRIEGEMEKNLIDKKVKLIKTQPIPGVYDAISHHPDIMLHHLGGRDIIIAPNAPKKLIEELEAEGFNLIFGKKEIGKKYPFDVAYNAARVGNKLICNVSFTDEVLLKCCEERGIKIIDVKQGYTKCSTCVVAENAIITSDSGIHKSLIEYDIDTLLITPGFIDLFNMNYGFIGGATGGFSGDEIAFYGNLDKHPDSQKIMNFFGKYEKKPLNLCQNTLIDMGTLIPLMEYSIV